MVAKIRRLSYSTFQNYDHVYLDAGEVFFAKALASSVCPCCASTFRSFTSTISQGRRLLLSFCAGCGWWHLRRQDEMQCSLTNERTWATWWELTHAVQTEINLASPHLPIETLRAHLARHWKDRNQISPQQAEDLVASVLREHLGGEIVRLTANAHAPDGGVDLYVVSQDGLVRRAVQVKRRISADVEAVKEVRNFVGAMVLTGSETGVFVTTATKFSKSASRVPKMAKESKHRLELDLIDGERLLEMLSFMNQRSRVQLPPLVTLDQEWLSEDGHSIVAAQLFFGDLCKLSEIFEQQ